jgi:acetolactate synthase I/III small subunit
MIYGNLGIINKVTKNVLSVLVENEAGVLARISGMFSRRGYNIESITVGPSEEEGLSRMVIVTKIDDVEQIQKQLHKLINTIKVANLSEQEYVDRELALVKVSTKTNRSEIIEIANLFRSRIIDVADDTMIIEAIGDSEKVSALIQILRPYGIKEVSRTGSIAMARGKAQK